MAVSNIAADIQDLVWYWNDREALHVNIEHFACWSNPAGDRARRIRRRVAQLSTKQVQILYAAYGPRNPCARIDVLDERVARLAPYVPMVEAARAIVVERLAAQTTELARRLSVRDPRPLTEAAWVRIEQSHLRDANHQVGPSDALRTILGPEVVRGRDETLAEFRMRQWRARERAATEIMELGLQATYILRGALAAYGDSQ